MAKEIRNEAMDLGFNISNHSLEIMDNLTGEVPEEIRSNITKQLHMIQHELQEFLLKVVLEDEKEKEIKLM